MRGLHHFEDGLTIQRVKVPQFLSTRVLFWVPGVSKIMKSWTSFWVPICLTHTQMAVGQNQWYRFGVGAPPILVHFSGDWDVHWQVSLHYTPDHCLVNGGVPLFWWKNMFQINGQHVSFFRSPAGGSIWILTHGNIIVMGYPIDYRGKG